MTEPNGVPGAEEDSLQTVVAELCAAEGIPLGDGDLPVVTRLYRELLDLADILKNEPLAMDAAPSLRLDITRDPDGAGPPSQA